MALSTHVNQQRAIRSQSEIITDQEKAINELKQYATNILTELQRVNGQLARFQNSEYRRVHVTQCHDFAINSLPFWKRSPKNIMERSRKFFADITAETNQLVEADTILYLAELEAKKKEEENKEAE